MLTTVKTIPYDNGGATIIFEFGSGYAFSAGFPPMPVPEVAKQLREMANDIERNHWKFAQG